MQALKNCRILQFPDERQALSETSTICQPRNVAEPRGIAHEFVGLNCATVGCDAIRDFRRPPSY